MDIETLCRSFLEALDKRNVDQVSAFFAPEALVNSPFFGRLPARDYFRKLFDSTWYRDVRLLGFYLPASYSASAVLHFNCSAVINESDSAEFEWVGIYELAASRRQFIRMTTFCDPSNLKTLKSSSSSMYHEFSCEAALWHISENRLQAYHRIGSADNTIEFTHETARPLTENQQ